MAGIRKCGRAASPNPRRGIFNSSIFSAATVSTDLVKHRQWTHIVSATHSKHTEYTTKQRSSRNRRVYSLTLQPTEKLWTQKEQTGEVQDHQRTQRTARHLFLTQLPIRIHYVRAQANVLQVCHRGPSTPRSLSGFVWSFSVAPSSPRLTVPTPRDVSIRGPPVAQLTAISKWSLPGPQSILLNPQAKENRTGRT